VPIDASGPPVPLHDALSTVQDVTEFVIGGGRVIFGGDVETNNRFEIFSAPLDGTGPPVKLNAPLVGLENISSFRVSGDGGTVAYQLTPGASSQIHAAPTDGLAPVSMAISNIAIIMTLTCNVIPDSLSEKKWLKWADVLSHRKNNSTCHR